MTLQCKGSYGLNTACGSCEKCKTYVSEMRVKLKRYEDAFDKILDIPKYTYDQELLSSPSKNAAKWKIGMIISIAREIE